MNTPPKIDLFDQALTPSILRTALRSGKAADVLTPESWAMVERAWEALSDTELLWPGGLDSQSALHDMLALSFIAMIGAAVEHRSRSETPSLLQHSPACRIRI